MPSPASRRPIFRSPAARLAASAAITLSGDTWQPAIEPDIPWSLRGTGGNIPVMLDQSGVL